MRITRKNCLGLVILFLLVILVINNIYKVETFSGLDNVEGMEKKMKEMGDLEEETRMFCKILRQDQDKVQIQDLLNDRNKDFKKLAKTE